jgi:hypothetical protein
MVAMSLSSVSVIGNALRLRGEAYNLVSPAACSRSRRCSGASGEHLSKAVTGAATGSKSKVYRRLLTFPLWEGLASSHSTLSRQWGIPMSAAGLASLPTEDQLDQAKSITDGLSAHPLEGRGLGTKYLVVAGVLGAFLIVLFNVLGRSLGDSLSSRQPEALLAPVMALVALTGLVWLLMVVFRNIAFIRGKVSERYFQTFTVGAPAEWVERPTRAYMNLLELPILFYVAAALMLITQTFDSVQVSLAWLFVFTRCAHAFIYIAFNYIPLRFVSYLTGVITLGVLWARFAEQSL